MSSHSRDPYANSDLKVYFEELNLGPAEQAGWISEQPLILFPLQAYDAAVDCSVLLNQEIIEIWQRNLNASFGLSRRLVEARSFSEIIELQAAHFSNHLAALIAQTEEFATLSRKATIDMLRRFNPGVGEDVVIHGGRDDPKPAL